MTVKPVAGAAIARMRDDLAAIFAKSEELAGVEPPRVTVDMPESEPFPNHVFVWGAARDFGVIGALSNMTLKITYHVYVTLVATAPTSDEAVSKANAYQSLALQVPLVDCDLGGTVEEVGVPQVAEADSWADADGRRHSGYLLDYEVSTYVAPSAECAAIIEEMI